MKVEIKFNDSQIEAEEIYEREVKTFGTQGGHVTIPKKWIGYKAIIVIKSIIKSFASSYAKNVKEKEKVK